MTTWIDQASVFRYTVDHSAVACVRGPWLYVTAGPAQTWQI